MTADVENVSSRPSSHALSLSSNTTSHCYSKGTIYPATKSSFLATASTIHPPWRTVSYHRMLLPPNSPIPVSDAQSEILEALSAYVSTLHSKRPQYVLRLIFEPDFITMENIPISRSSATAESGQCTEALCAREARSSVLLFPTRSESPAPA